MRGWTIADLDGTFIAETGANQPGAYCAEVDPSGDDNLTTTDVSHHAGPHPPVTPGTGRGAEPVFIVGMNGSGTTMLLESLGRHPGLYAFPRETRLIPHLYAHREGFGDLSDDRNFLRLWNKVRHLTVFQYVNGGAEVPLPADWAAYPRDLSAVLDAVFRYFAAREGKSRWCEKTPQHAQHLHALSRMYPHARFVHVIRDGRDCAASFHRRWSRTPELTMYRWKRLVRDARRQGRQLGAERYLELWYEKITSEPELWLRRVSDFVGLEFDPAVLQSRHLYLQTQATPAVAPAGTSLRPNSGKWRHYFTPGQCTRLEEIGGAALHEFGYETSIPAGDRDLSALKQRTCAVKDALIQYSREIALKLGGRIERPWRIILTRPVVAWRHRRVNRY